MASLNAIGDDRGNRIIGIVTIVAAVTSLASLVVGLAGGDFDFDAFSEADTFIALGADAADPVKWGLWLSIFGYLLLVPIAVHLFHWLRSSNTRLADVSTIGAGFYLLLGAAGAGILASTAPYLMEQYSGADAAVRAGLLRDFDLARRIAEDGLQGVVQNVAGATWFLGIGALLRPQRRGLGVLATVVGAALVVNTVAILVDVEALRMIGLTGTVLLAPAWAIWLGASLLRSSATP